MQPADLPHHPGQPFEVADALADRDRLLEAGQRLTVTPLVTQRQPQLLACRRRLTRAPGRIQPHHQIPQIAFGHGVRLRRERLLRGALQVHDGLGVVAGMREVEGQLIHGVRRELARELFQRLGEVAMQQRPPPRAQIRQHDLANQVMGEDVALRANLFEQPAVACGFQGRQQFLLVALRPPAAGEEHRAGDLAASHCRHAQQVARCFGERRHPLADSLRHLPRHTGDPLRGRITRRAR